VSLSHTQIDQEKQVGHRNMTCLLTVPVLNPASPPGVPFLHSHEGHYRTLGIKEKEIKSGLWADKVVKISSFANTLCTAGAGLVVFRCRHIKLKSQSAP
jgi:hypothetical protein